MRNSPPPEGWRKFKRIFDGVVCFRRNCFCGYHAEEVFSNKWIKEKINYIHQNPVKQKIVAEPEHYYFCSARNYPELDNALDVFVVFM